MVHVHDVRNFRYRTTSDYLPAWYDATYDLNGLDSVDLVTSYWAGENIAHVFLSFGFSDGQHLAISIETRRQARFPYSTIAGFFHHYELFYVTADERDLIGVRTDVRHERVYLYRLDLQPDVRTRLFLSYVSAIHDITRHPVWYNTLTDNCTTGILARAGARLRYRFDWRVILSGHTADLAYDMGLLGPYDPTRYPTYDALHAASRINRPPDAVIGMDYSPPYACICLRQRGRVRRDAYCNECCINITQYHTSRSERNCQFDNIPCYIKEFLKINNECILWCVTTIPGL